AARKQWGESSGELLSERKTLIFGIFQPSRRTAGEFFCIVRRLLTPSRLLDAHPIRALPVSHSVGSRVGAALCSRQPHVSDSNLLCRIYGARALSIDGRRCRATGGDRPAARDVRVAGGRAGAIAVRAGADSAIGAVAGFAAVDELA